MSNGDGSLRFDNFPTLVSKETKEQLIVLSKELSMTQKQIIAEAVKLFKKSKGK